MKIAAVSEDGETPASSTKSLGQATPGRWSPSPTGKYTAYRAPVLARLPIDPELARLGDGGRIAAYDGALLADLAQAFETNR